MSWSLLLPVKTLGADIRLHNRLTVQSKYKSGRIELTIKPQDIKATTISGLTTLMSDMHAVSIGVEISIKQTFRRFLQAPILVDLGETIAITGRMIS